MFRKWNGKDSWHLPERKCEIGEIDKEILELAVEPVDIVNCTENIRFILQILCGTFIGRFIQFFNSNGVSEICKKKSFSFRSFSTEVFNHSLLDIVSLGIRTHPLATWLQSVYNFFGYSAEHLWPLQRCWHLVAFVCFMQHSHWTYKPV